MMPDPHADVRATLPARSQAVMKQFEAARRKEKRDRGGRTLLIVGLGAGLAWAVWNNNKLAEKAEGKEVVYATVQANGEMISSVHYNEMPPAAKQEDSLHIALWAYVQSRDCFNLSDFPRQAYIAQAMSDMRVGRQVHEQFDLANPQSPRRIYGEHGLTVHCELVDPPVPIGGNNDIYFFRFQRWVDNGRMTPADIANSPFYSVSVKYRLGVYPADPRRAWVDKSTFNAPGVQVVDYPGATPDNARPPIRLSARATGNEASQ